MAKKKSNGRYRRQTVVRDSAIRDMARVSGRTYEAMELEYRAMMSLEYLRTHNPSAYAEYKKVMELSAMGMYEEADAIMERSYREMAEKMERLL